MNHRHKTLKPACAGFSAQHLYFALVLKQPQFEKKYDVWWLEPISWWWIV